jgi:eukaryotic-like serine/threonine-protein kinase
MSSQNTEPDKFDPDSHDPGSQPTQANLTQANLATTPSVSSWSNLREPRPNIGAYRILDLLGEGGMGTVYRAEQQNPQRIVALKVIRIGVAGAEQLRRFEQEAKLLGRLQHPGIAQIYEAGTARSEYGAQPYFAMEYIQGLPLSQYANRYRLDMRARLELMVRICDAVNHAHQRGIIHRDLKPVNILVDESGQPKILDFGVARVTDSDTQATRQTDMGQLIGTLAYMSPEQVLADPLELDTRSDVYALGVILYELLAGKAPYNTERKALHEVVQVIREEDPTPLSSINRRYRGDVETIVAKALEKDKGRRYASAAELGADIRRYLTDEPIVARPPTASYQLKKFARRNQAFVAGTAAVFLVLVAGIIVSSREAVVARRAQQLAAKEAASANAVVDFLRNDLLGQASARNQASFGAKLDRDIKVRTALDRAAARIEGKFDKQPEVEAAIRDAMGKTYEDLGDYAESQKQLQRALVLERQVWGTENPKTLNTLNHLGRTLWHQGKFQEAQALLGPALPIEQRVLGPAHLDTLYCMINLGNVNRSQGHDELAEPFYRQALETGRRAWGLEQPETLTAMNDLANVYWSQGNYAQAEALYTEAMQTQRRVLGPEHPDTLLSMGNLADTYSMQGKYAQAEPLFTQTIEISRRVLGPEHTRTLEFLSDFSTMYQRQGQYAQAETYAAQVLAAYQRAGSSEDPADVQFAMCELALIYVSEGKFAEGERLARQTLEFGDKNKLDSWERFRAESLLGASLAGEKKYAEAEPLLLEGYQGMYVQKDKMGVAYRYHIDRAREWLAQLYQSWGKPEKAAEWRKT